MDSAKKSQHGPFYFFIGTVAELLKVMPVMQELQKRKVPFKIIASGQNDITVSDALGLMGIDRVDVTISKDPIKQTAVGLIFWFFKTFFRAIPKLKAEFKGLKRGEGYLIVHGDTVSTVMGAVLGRILGRKVAHIEAGYRSGHFFQPFPEEIDRVLTSYFARAHFYPYEGLLKNIARRKGDKINTFFNTSIDGLAFAVSQPTSPKILEQIGKKKFFIFILHRQENLMNEALVRKLIAFICEQAKKDLVCLFVTHETTYLALERFGLLHQVESTPGIILTKRLPYFDFIKVLNQSEFLMTDGGGNQQETYFMGKPCIILRNVTEGKEGLGTTTVLSKLDPEVIGDFMKNYSRYAKPPIMPERRPSQIIVDYLLSGA